MKTLYNTGVYERSAPPEIPEEHKDIIHNMIHDLNTVDSRDLMNTVSHTATEDTMEKIRRVVYTERGKLAEDSIMDWYVTSSHMKHNSIVSKPDRFFKIHCVKDNQEFFIGGRVDGLLVRTNDSTSVLSVIEIKSRQEGFITPIPEYERVQIECYMNMMHTDRCVFIQEYNGEYRVEEYVPDNTLWNNILIGLSEATNRIKT
jgi:hypothetical protein